MGAIPDPPVGSAGTLVFSEHFGDINERLEYVEAAVTAAIESNLQARKAGTWGDSDDALFGPYTSFAAHCIKSLLPERATRLWLVDLLPIVEAAQQGTRPEIHVGSPLYNCGLCFFFAGDFDRFYQFVAAADDANRRLTSAPPKLLIGGGIAESVLVDPIVAWLSAEWGVAYLTITGNTLNRLEYVSLMDWLYRRLADAMHVVLSLHRFRLQRPPDNSASRHIRVRAVADLCIVLESTTKEWNAGQGGQLNAHATTIATTLGCSSEYGRLDTAFSNRFAAGAPRESAQAVNWVCAECVRLAQATSSVQQRQAASLYLAVRLRNSLLHVLEDQLDVYSNRQLLLQVGCLVFSAIRLSRFASGG